MVDAESAKKLSFKELTGVDARQERSKSYEPILFEQRGKEKVKDLLNEGQSSQAFYRSGAPKRSLLNGLPKLL